jgi:predicted small lipoprotein YifL
MSASIHGAYELKFKSAMWPARGAILASLVIALGLGLGGCGRKGGLDPPPVAASPVNPAMAQPPAAPEGTGVAPAPAPASPPPRATWLDWLIN